MRRSLITGIIIHIHINLRHLTRTDFYGRHIILTIEIIGVEQVVFFGEKGVLAGREGDREIAAGVGLGAFDEPGFNTAVKSRFGNPGQLAEICEFVNIKCGRNAFGRTQFNIRGRHPVTGDLKNIPLDAGTLRLPECRKQRQRR